MSSDKRSESISKTNEIQPEDCEGLLEEGVPTPTLKEKVSPNTGKRGAFRFKRTPKRIPLAGQTQTSKLAEKSLIANGPNEEATSSSVSSFSRTSFQPRQQKNAVKPKRWTNNVPNPGASQKPRNPPSGPVSTRSFPTRKLSVQVPVDNPNWRVGKWLKASCRSEAAAAPQVYMEPEFWSNFRATSDFAYKMALQDSIRQICALKQEKSKLAKELDREKEENTRLARELNYLTVAMRKASITFGRIRRLSIFKMPIIEPPVESTESSEPVEESSEEEQTVIHIE